MKLITAIILICLSFHSYSYEAEYPQAPIENLTPGDLCHRPDSFRYPERIAYCNRNVDTDLKNDVFIEYRRAGFELPKSDRSSYKIDHFIPLCAGGSNEFENLWPQHKSVYQYTDKLEHKGCEKLQNGKITQTELIKLIKIAKRDVRKAGKILQLLNSL